MPPCSATSSLLSTTVSSSELTLTRPSLKALGEAPQVASNMTALMATETGLVGANGTAPGKVYAAVVGGDGRAARPRRRSRSGTSRVPVALTLPGPGRGSTSPALMGALHAEQDT